MDLVSVIIPSWNRKEDLHRILKSLETQDYPNFETIVIDNGSKDGSIELVHNKFPNVKLHLNKINYGACIAKNQGIILSKGEYVHFLDSDTEMTHPSVISNMVKILKENPDIGAVGGEAYKINNKVITKRKEITLNCETSTYTMKTDDYILFPCGYIATCNSMMRKRDIKRCKGFDPKLFYLGEDKEIGYKLKKIGLKSVIDSRCLVYHYVSESARNSVFYLFHKNRIRIVLMNYPLYIIPILPLLDIAYIFSLKKIRELKGNNRDVLKWVSNNEKIKKSSNLKKIIVVGSNYLISLIHAYLYNILFFPKIMYLRIKNKDFLEETREKWL